MYTNCMVLNDGRQIVKPGQCYYAEAVAPVARSRGNPSPVQQQEVTYTPA